MFWPHFDKILIGLMDPQIYSDFEEFEFGVQSNTDKKNKKKSNTDTQTERSFRSIDVINLFL